MIVDSWDSRKEPARSLHDALAVPIKSDGHPAVTPRRWHNDRAVALRHVNNFQTGIYWLSLAVCFISVFVFRSRCGVVNKPLAL